MNRRTENYLKRKISIIYLSTISEIEEKLEPYDLHSLVFLLYDVPATALSGLISLSGISSRRHSMNLLTDWAQAVQSATGRTSWRYELLEVLTLCQLNSIIKTLGFDVEIVQKYFQPENIHYAINISPVKKALYKLCENITDDKLVTLRATLKTYGLKVHEYNCEMMILDMICNNLISIGAESGCKNIMKNNYCNVETLVKITEKIGLSEIAKDLRDVEIKYNTLRRNINDFLIDDQAIETTSKDDPDRNADDSNSKSDVNESQSINDRVTANDLHDIFAIINDTQENITLEHLKCDTTVENKTVYPIKNRERLGVCCIVNQVDFHPSKHSIESGVPPLDKRVGSNKDKTTIEKTMSELNFDVQVLTNVTDKEMLEMLKDIVKFKVKSDDSMFFLFVLSHGEQGCVYAANSVSIKIDIIKDLLENNFAHRNLTDIPKVLVIQGCQDDVKLCSDGLKYMPKSNFLVFWATSPKLKAYRNEVAGSIFIQFLCSYISKYAKSEHLEDIFTRVIDDVATECSIRDKEQMPMYSTTLRKKIFMVAPLATETVN